MRISFNQNQDYIEYETRGGRTVEIVDITVRSQRRVGIGTRLVQAVENKITRVGPRKLYAMTRSVNASAITFYRSLGFKVLSVAPNFYKDTHGTDMTLMGKDI